MGPFSFWKQRLLRRRVATLLLVALSLTTTTLASPQGEIQKTYDKRYRAAEMLYFYGMRHGRVDDFSITDLSGEKVDYEEFLAKSESQMKQYLKAQWYGRIEDFEQLSETKVRCRVRERFDAVARDSRYTANRLLSSAVLSDDIWELREGQWVQVSATVLHQGQKSTAYRATRKLIDLPPKPDTTATSSR